MIQDAFAFLFFLNVERDVSNHVNLNDNLEVYLLKKNRHLQLKF